MQILEKWFHNSGIKSSRMGPQKKGPTWLWVFLAVCLILLDQLTKFAAVKLLRDRPAKSILPGIFELAYVENRGAAFGMLPNKHILFVLFALVIVILCVAAFRRIPPKRRFLPLQILLVLIFSGAVGNMIDRILHGYVIDFLYFSLIDFPVFNVADIYVTVSCVLLLIFLFFVYSEEELDILLRPKRRERYLRELAEKIEEAKNNSSKD